MMWFSWILIFLIGAIVVVVFLNNSTPFRQKGGGASDETPLEILKKRYARGEISDAEFEAMKEKLK